MEFKLKRPCPKCPFRTDCLEGWLGGARASEIVYSITIEQQNFACHETTVHDDESGEHVSSATEIHCAGALIMLENIEYGVGQNARIAERLGVLDMDSLDWSSPVFASVEDFIDHHAGGEEEGECCETVDYGCEAPAGHMGSGGAVRTYTPEGLTACCDDCGSYVCENCTCWCKQGDDDD